MGNITRKMCFITMHERVNVFSQNDECALGIAFAGESRCDEKFFISRKNSDITSLEYIVDGKGTLIIDGQTLYPKKGDVFLLTKGSGTNILPIRMNRGINISSAFTERRSRPCFQFFAGKQISF